MDLNKLFVIDSVVIEIKHPVTDEVLMDESKKPKVMSVTVLGKHTKEFKKIQRKFGHDSIKKNNKSVNKMTFTEYEKAAEELESNSIILLSKIIVDCSLFIDGEFVKCDEKSLIELFSNPMIPWLSEFIVGEMENRELFFKS